MLATKRLRPLCLPVFLLFFLQNGGSCHDAEIHMVHVREGTDDELLVVGILLDASMFGYNNEVRSLVSLVRALLSRLVYQVYAYKGHPLLQN